MPRENAAVETTEETENATELEFPEPILDLIKTEALKRIKTSAKYTCVNGHMFKGKDVLVEVEEEDDIIRVHFTCPTCEIDKIMIPNPILVLNMNVG